MSKKHIESKLVLEGRDLYALEEEEEIVDKEIQVLLKKIVQSKKEKKDSLTEELQGEIRDCVKRLISDVEMVLKELEQAKKEAELEELQKLKQIKELINEESEVDDLLEKKFLELEEHIQHRIGADVHKYVEGEKRLIKGDAPRGYIIKKLLSAKQLDLDVKETSQKLVLDEKKEKDLFLLIQELIDEHKGTISNQQEIRRKIIKLIEMYKKNFDQFLNIEVDIEIEQAHKIHRIDQYILFLKKLNMETFCEQLEQLKDRTSFWVYQDFQDAEKMELFTKTMDRHLKELIEERH